MNVFWLVVCILVGTFVVSFVLGLVLERILRRREDRKCRERYDQ